MTKEIKTTGQQLTGYGPPRLNCWAFPTRLQTGASDSSARRRRQIGPLAGGFGPAAVRFSPPADRLSPAADVLGKADAALGPQLAGLLWSEKFRTLVESQLESRAGSSGSRI